MPHFIFILSPLLGGHWHRPVPGQWLFRRAAWTMSRWNDLAKRGMMISPSGPHMEPKKKKNKKRGETVTLTLMISIFCIICIHKYIYIYIMCKYVFLYLHQVENTKNSGCFCWSCLVLNQSYWASLSARSLHRHLWQRGLHVVQLHNPYGLWII